MKKFTIYHPLDGEINHDLKRGHYMYDFIANLQADSLEQAFILAQNDFNSEYRQLGVRSTCIGDIITNDEKCYFVAGRGFIEIPSTVLSYIDWGVLVPDIDETDKIRY